MAIPPMAVGNTQYRGGPILPPGPNVQSWGSPAPVAPTPAAPDYRNLLSRQLSGFWGQNKIDPNIRGINRADELAGILSHFGITDLGQLSLKSTQTEMPGEWVTGYQNDNEIQQWVDPYTKTNYQLAYGDKTFGDLGGVDSKGRPLYLTTPAQQHLQDLGNNTYRIAGSAAGKGVVDYIAKFTPEGKLAGIVPQWKSSSDAGDILKALSVFAIPLTGGLSSTLAGAGLGTLGGQVAANALVQGTLGGLGSLAGGGSFGSGFGKSALLGGIGGGISNLASPYISKFANTAGLGTIGTGALTGAANSGINALLRGNSLGSALLYGGLGGALGAGAKQTFGGPDFLRNMAVSSLMSNIRRNTRGNANAGLRSLMARRPPGG